MKNKEIKHIDLNSIKDPNFVKDLSMKELNTLAEDIRSHLIYITSQNGGHLSSNLGVIESTISLCHTFDFSKDKIIFDVGHQSYTYKLLTGRNLSSLRKKDGISGFQKLNESIYDHYEAGHSSTSISAALGMAVARDLSKENYDIIAYIGDSSIVSGLSFEGLNNVGQDKHKIIVILNDNDMSISTSVGALSRVFRRYSTSKLYRSSASLYHKIMYLTKIGARFYNWSARIKNKIKRRLISMTIFDNLGFSVIGPINGHNIDDLNKAFERAKANDKPTLVVIKTIKGKGYKYAENDRIGAWHGVSKFDINTGKMTNSFNCSWSKFYASLVDKKMEKDEKVVTITPGTGYGSSLNDLFIKYPKRMIDVGIAEEHALILASGLSVNKYHPIISIYSTFLQRAYDELSHDLARMKLDATILIDRSGLVGNDGETHQGIYDEAYLASIPNITISMASNSKCAEILFNESFLHHGPFAIRYPREETPKGEITNFKYGEWVKEKLGKDIALISLGPIIEELKELIKDKDVTLYNAIYIKPIDYKALDSLLNYKKIIIYDVYGTINGLCKDIASYLMQKSYKGELIIKALPDEFIKQASINEQREQYKLLPSDIIKLI